MDEDLKKRATRWAAGPSGASPSEAVAAAAVLEPVFSHRDVIEWLEVSLRLSRAFNAPLVDAASALADTGAMLSASLHTEDGSVVPDVEELEEIVAAAETREEDNDGEE